VRAAAAPHHLSAIWIRSRLKLLALLILWPALVLATPDLASNGDPYLDKYLGNAARLRAEGNVAAAREAIEKALERDDRHLEALQALAELAEAGGDTDTSVWAYHRWLSVVDSSKKPGASRKVRKEILAKLALLDLRSEDFRSLSTDHLGQLHKLAKDHAKKGRFHSALEIYAEMLLIDPYHADARAGVKHIRRTGGKDVAVEDAFAGGGDPTEGLDPEWLATENAKHDTWETAWTKDTENYRYKTDAGFLVMQTSSIAMEQMNQAYRKFFAFKEDGGATPKIGVLVYKNRDEYLKYNNLPENDWTGGFFNGSTVQTFLGGASGTETIRQMYGTLFHEAAHQFVSLTGRGGVPGWLNEGYASFFEGTTILSNGSVRWNQPATHRLFPLARRMDSGWMANHSEGVRDETGEWGTPENAPSLRILVENQYQWGPPWYAPTWGLVFFLYNYRNDDGKLVYRESLREYYYSGAGSKGFGDRVNHFEEFVIDQAPLSPVKDIDALSEIWKDWMLELRDIQLGKRAARKSNFEHGSAALARGELTEAVEFLEEAYTHQPEDPEVLWILAGALETQKEYDRASGLYLQFTRELEMRGMSDDERYELGKEKLRKLDPLFRRHAALKVKMLDKGLELAKSYRQRQMPLMALEIARRMSAQFSLPEALDFYIAVAEETGKSLARWKVAYNELDLSGWSGSDAYSAYGAMIEAKLVDDEAAGRAPGEFFTADLTYDQVFSGDYSLEAEIRMNPEKSTVAGLTFGRKDANTTHAVILHPTGFLDISTKDGGTWTFRDHRTVALREDWQKLRIDLVGKVLDVYLNDQYIRSLEMPSRDSVQGGFGLITGTGEVSFRSLRFLARDPYDPAARIERELALAKVASAEIDRPTGTFSGSAPPEFGNGLIWLQRGDQTASMSASSRGLNQQLQLEDLKGRPAALIFWSAIQEKVIPTAKYYDKLAKEYAEYGYQFVLLIGGEHLPGAVDELLQNNPLNRLHVGYDTDFAYYKSCNVVPDGWGMPRILVLDVDNTVIWEGDPGLQPGRGWVEGDSETYLDGPLKELLGKRNLKALYQHLDAGVKAERYYRAGMYRVALSTIQPLAQLDAEFAPEVIAARDLVESIEGAGAWVLGQGESHLEAGFLLRAEAFFAKVAEEFKGTATGDLASQRLGSLTSSKLYRDARKHWRDLEKIAKGAENLKAIAELNLQFQELDAQPSVAEIQQTSAAMQRALLRDGHAALLEEWQSLSPAAQLMLALETLTSDSE